MSAPGASAALRDARPAVYWLDRPDRPDASEVLTADARADLVVVGAGYTGLWAALQAKEDDPSREVVVIDAGRVGEQASGRNGGFCSASLTHGINNGVERFPSEIHQLQRLGRDTLDAIEATLVRHGINCDFERVGGISVATEPWQLSGLRATMELEARHGDRVEWLEQDAVRAEIDSPTFLAGTWKRTGEALVDPARLAWGLAAALGRLGVAIHEGTPMTGLERSGSGVVVRTPHATLRAAAVVLGTNAFPSPVRRIRRMVAPVYDHVLMTEPLSPSQLEAVGWRNGQGLADSTNLFHYSRLTRPTATEGPRILWGGYDAVYHYGNRIDPSLEQRDATHLKLAEQFAATFPQLAELGFSHRWGGVIDTCSRFSVFFGTALDGRVAYATGYTGLGVGASRFGARVCLDLLDDPGSPLLQLALVRRAPLPFPPEPARWVGITLTRRALERADNRQGRRGPWLRLLDRAGLGFDS